MKTTTFLTALAVVASLEVRTVEYESDILPIFQSKCGKCHLEGESKGGVALDLEDVGKEIGSGKAIVPGDVEKSDLYELVSKAEDDDDRMPPPGKGQPLSSGEMDKLKEWIEAGAPVGDEKPAMDKPEVEEGLTKRPDPIDGDWTNNEGKTIKATLMRIEGNNAILRMNGREFPYPISSLAAESQAVVKQFAEASSKASGS